MNDIELKEKIKEIYDFVEMKTIHCFYCCGYDYHPNVKLEDLIDPNKKLYPNICIHLNTSSPNYLGEKKIIQDRFPHYFFIHSNYNNQKNY